MHTAAHADRGQPLLLRRGRAPARGPGPHRPAAGRAPAAARRRPRRHPQAPAAAAPRGPRGAPGGRGRGPRLRAHHASSGRPGIGRADLLERLDEALAVQLLEEAPGPAGSFRFAHGLIRETLYGDLTATAPRPAARRGGRGARAHGRERGRAGPPLRRGGAGRRSRPRRSSTPTAPGTRRWRRSPTSAPPTSSTRRWAPSTCCPSPTSRRRGELLLLRGQAQMQSGGDAARSTLLAAIELARRVGDTDLLGARGAQPGRLRPVAGHGRRRPRRRARGGARAACSPTAARCARGCSCAWPSRCTTPTRRSAARSSSRRRWASRAGSTTRRRWPTSSTRATSPPTGPTPPSAGWPGRTSSSRWPTPPATPSSSVRARSWQIDLLLELDDIAGADMAIEALGPHRHRLARPARPRLHPAAPRAAGHDLRAPGRHRAAHPRGHPAGLEPAGLDRPDPRRRPALLAAPGPGPRARARGRGAPVRRSAPGHAGLARGAGHRSTCTPAARRRRAASTTASPSATSRPSRATTSGRWPSRMLAELSRDLPRRRALGRCSRSS